jgi:hypothetical protein
VASGRKRRQRRARLTEVKSLERNTPPVTESTPQPAPDAKPVESEVMFGDGGLHAGKGNMALLRRAYRERWPMTDERRAMLLDQMFGIVEKSPDPRNKIAAAKVIVTADSINVNQQKIDTPKESNVNVNVSGGMAVGVSVGAVTANLREQMLNDDSYLEYLRLNPSDGNASPVREDGEPGPVEDGEASGGA